jgi:hypothetical protein
MKSKSVTYGLIVLVIAIWGGIFYRIFVAYDSENTAVVPVRKAKVIPAVAEIETETGYSLSANYRDPFLGAAARVIEKSDSKQLSPKKKVKEEVKIDWSFVRYLGTIKNSATRKKLILINVRSRDYTVSEGENAGDIKVLKNNSDSILVSYQGKVKWIKH